MGIMSKILGNGGEHTAADYVELDMEDVETAGGGAGMSVKIAEISGKHDVIDIKHAIYDGDLVAECDCRGYKFDDWCAHVAACWWQWAALGDLAVTDLATGRTYLSPPWWLDVRGGEP